MNAPDPLDADASRAAASPAPAIDRGISPVGQRLGGARQRWITLGALALGCGAFLAATWDRGGSRKDATPNAEAPPRQLAPFEPAPRAHALRDDGLNDVDAPVLDPNGPEAVPPLEVSAAGPEGGPAPSRQVDDREALAQSARRAPLLAWRRSGTGDASGPSGGAAGALPRQPDTTRLDALRQSRPVARVNAGQVGDRNLLITAGTAIPCVLQTAMDSSTPGYVVCHLPSDVYSDNGAIVLMERGTRVLGEYQGGLQQGRSRLFVLWTRALTPTGVSIALASPAADALGRSGFDGRIDTHFWARLGGALLLSMVDNGVAAIDDGDRHAGSARAPSDAASTALEASVDIPPTLRKDQGAEVSIFVAQDLDFSSVYQPRAR